MCDPTTALWVGVGLNAVGVGANMYASNQNQKAMAAAQMAETSRQRQQAERQRQLALAQEAQKAKSRKEHGQTVAQLSPDNTRKEEAGANAELNQKYTAAAASVPQGNPNAGVSEVTTVSGEPTSNGGTPVPLAVSAAYADANKRAALFANRRAAAQAFMDSLNLAQNRSATKLARGLEKVGMRNEFISGLQGQVGGIEGVKDASQSMFAMDADTASRKGSTAAAIGGGMQSLGQLSYAYGSSGKK